MSNKYWIDKSTNIIHTDYFSHFLRNHFPNEKTINSNNINIIVQKLEQKNENNYNTINKITNYRLININNRESFCLGNTEAYFMIFSISNSMNVNIKFIENDINKIKQEIKNLKKITTMFCNKLKEYKTEIQLANDVKRLDSPKDNKNIKPKPSIF